jgi:hypothetical protein
VVEQWNEEVDRALRYFLVNGFAFNIMKLTIQANNFKIKLVIIQMI